jgi:hypothetical protein
MQHKTLNNQMKGQGTTMTTTTTTTMTAKKKTNATRTARTQMSTRTMRDYDEVGVEDEDDSMIG